MKPLVTAVLLGSTAAAPAAAASYIDSTSTFYTGGATTLVNATGFDFKPIDFGKSVSVGKIYGSSFTGHYGARVTASVGAKLEVAGSLSFQNTIGQVSSGKVETYAGNPFGALTSSFVLGTSYSNKSSLTFGGGGQVDASLSATAYAGANVSGKACLVECISGTIANLGIGNPAAYNILGYHSATNSVTFLNKDYDNVLPQEFYSDTLPISAKLEAVNVAGKGTGVSASGYTTTQTIAGAYIDVAKAIADSFGLPNDVLSGSVLGFDYTTVAAQVGAGINARYDVTTSTIGEFTDYRFSTAVQLLNQTTGVWGKATTEAILNDGEVAIVRPISQVASLSILPSVVTDVNVNTKMTLYAEVEDHIKLLEVSGHGIDAGPLYQQDGTVDLGTIASFSKAGAIFANTTLAPLTLTFDAAPDALAAPLAAAGHLTRAAADDAPVAFGSSGERGFVFVPDDPGATGDTVAGKIYLATNFGTRGCNADGTFLCVFDRSFTPIAEQQRTTRSATGAPELSYAVDFATIDRYAAAPDGAYGDQGSPDTLRALIAGFADRSYTLPADIAGNTTPFQPGIPEPASWAMMVAGFGLVGGLRRHRTRVVAA